MKKLIFSISILAFLLLGKSFSQTTKTLDSLAMIEFYENKDYDKAFDYCNKAIQIDPNSANALYLRAIIYDLKGNSNLAAIDREKAKKLNPRLDYYEKLFKLSMVIEESPQKDTAYFIRGRVYENLENDESALKDYSKTIELNPKYIEAYFCRASCYGRMNAFNKAIEDYNYVIRFEPGNSDAYIRRGASFYGKNEKDKACNDWRKALELGNQSIKPTIDLYCK